QTKQKVYQKKAIFHFARCAFVLDNAPRSCPPKWRNVLCYICLLVWIYIPGFYYCLLWHLYCFTKLSMASTTLRTQSQRLSTLAQCDRKLRLLWRLYLTSLVFSSEVSA